MPEATEQRILRGIPVSEGVCQGKVFVLTEPHEPVIPRYIISEGELAEQTYRLEQALMRTREQLRAVQQRVHEAMGAGDAGIFDAHLLLMEDPMLLEEVIRTMQKQKVNVEYAFSAATAKFVDALSGVEDDYLRERAADMRDVAARIMNNLLGRDETSGTQILEPCVLVAYDLTPSRTAMLDKRLVLGFATDQGSKTSHTAILARSLQIPAVTGLQDASQRLRTGQQVLLDGFNGCLILDPTDQTLEEYGQLTRKRLGLRERLQELRDQPAVTSDGRRVTLSANIEAPAETEDVMAFGAEGVGLFRTEYLFLNRDTLPSEEEQFEAYHRVATALHPRPLIIRTLDLGGDKVLAQHKDVTEHNPFLGWRAIRICLQERDLFRDQLRAILRASVAGNIKMMYPMISGPDEVSQANQLVEQYQAELRAEGIAFDETIEIGVMIEIPAAVLTAEALAKRVRFFSIGTNDLIQYSLAVDRMNPKIAHLYEPTHPAVLRLIKTATDAAHANGIWVGVCGEMAADPVLAPLLLGLGVDELSVAPALVPAIKHVVRQLRLSDAAELAEFALRCESGADILTRAKAFAKKVAPTLFEEPSS